MEGRPTVHDLEVAALFSFSAIRKRGKNDPPSPLGARY
jgi:hypothetical protein